MGVSTARAQFGHLPTLGPGETAVLPARHGENTGPRLGSAARGQNSQRPPAGGPGQTRAAVTVRTAARGSRSRHGCPMDLEPRVRLPSRLVPPPGISSWLATSLVSSHGLSSEQRRESSGLSRSFSPPEPCLMAYGVLVPQPGIEPGPSALKVPPVDGQVALSRPLLMKPSGLWIRASPLTSAGP